jgi:excisionase family DNA binding protein
MGDVLTLSEVAAYLRLPEADVVRFVEEQALPGRRLGNEWRFLKDAIDDWLRSGPAPKANKEAWMSLAGVWKDDPHLHDYLRQMASMRARIADES